MGKTSLTGTAVGVDVTAAQKIWRSFQAVGDIAFAYAYATVLIEIQASYIHQFHLSLITFEYEPLNRIVVRDY